MIVYAIVLGPENDTGGYWFSFGDVIIQFVVAMLGLAGLSFTFFADKQKEEPAPTEPTPVNETNIKSEGGTVIEGDVSVTGDFTGRDKHVHHHHPSSPEPAVDPEALWEQFRQLPIEVVPEVGDVPAGSYFNVPVNLEFVGRQSQLIQLAQMVAQDGGSSSVAIAATGLGGIGKTQLAAAFCHRYGRYFGGGVYWLNFESEESARTDLAQMALLLNESWQTLTIDEQITMVLNDPDGWTADIPRLLVFDNLEDPKLLKKYKPARGGCRLLLTSRRGDWERVGITGLSTLPLGVLDRAESVALIQKLAPHVNDSGAETIAQELGDLPLALHVAGAYLNFFADSVSVESYITDLKAFSVTGQLGEQAADIEEEESVNPTDHTWHIGRTFRLSYDRLLNEDDGKVDGAEGSKSTSVNGVAQRLLGRAAVLAAGAVLPTEMLFETFDLDAAATAGDDETEPIAFEKKTGQKGINRLIRLGLLDSTLFGEESGIMIHRLIADFVQATDGQSKEDDTLARQALLDRCHQANNAGYPRQLLLYHPHLYHLLNEPQLQIDVQTADLLNAFGSSLQSLGDLAGAKPYYVQALEISREILGDKHPSTATSLNNMGLLLQDMGDLAGAKPYYVQALEISREILGDKHPSTAQSLNSLGALLYAMGDLTGAKSYHDQALEIRREVLGGKHPSTAQSLNNFGYLLYAMGDLAGAKPYYVQALEISQEVLGDKHPSTATSLNNMGALLYAMGDLAGAKPYYVQALEISQEVLGDKHPSTATSLNNMGMLLKDMGDLAEAKPYLEQALEISQEVLGDKHPDTATSLNNMGMLLKDMGDLAEAKPYLEQALEISQEVLGDKHPDTAASLNNLGLLLKAIKDNDES
jgi:tetratricopeptide (TPR) repeat protein